MAGVTESYGEGIYDALLLKLSPDGEPIWYKTWGGTNLDNAYDVALDSSGNIYVTGDYQPNGKSSRTFLFKYSTNGQLLWNRTLDLPLSNTGYSLVIDNANNIFVTGFITDNKNENIILFEYTSDGVLKYNNTKAIALEGRAYGIAIDNSGDLCITGYASNSKDFGDVLLAYFTYPNDNLNGNSQSNPLIELSMQFALIGVSVIVIAIVIYAIYKKHR